MSRRCVWLPVLFVAIGTVPLSADKSATQQPVSLIVTVHAQDSGSNLCGLCGDTEGDAIYTDGQDGIKAVIDQYGNVIIDLQTTRARIRWFSYRYDRPLAGNQPTPPATGSNHYLSTIALPGPFVPLQQMGIGPSQQQAVASCPLYDDMSGQPQYRVGFRRDCQSGLDMSATSPVIVTRTGASTWVLESGPQAAARVFAITTKGRGQILDYGFFFIPFKMTLQVR